MVILSAEGLSLEGRRKVKGGKGYGLVPNENAEMAEVAEIEMTGMAGEEEEEDVLFTIPLSDSEDDEVVFEIAGGGGVANSSASAGTSGGKRPERHPVAMQTRGRTAMAAACA